VIHGCLTALLCTQREQGQGRDLSRIRGNSVRSLQAHRDRRPSARPHAQHQPDEVRRPRLPPRFLPSHARTSVLGIIAIPGMMTGAILGGSSVQQAARLQMVIMFMISSSTALAAIAATVCALAVVVDADCRVRADMIDGRPHAVWRGRNWLVQRAAGGVRTLWHKALGKKAGHGSRSADAEAERLLG
jgi:hypothetical protein